MVLVVPLTQITVLAVTVLLVVVVAVEAVTLTGLTVVLAGMAVMEGLWWCASKSLVRDERAG